MIKCKTYPEKQIKDLEDKARDVRRLIVKMLAKAGSGHPGGSLSSTDLMACLYFSVLRHDPKNPNWPDPYGRVMIHELAHECGWHHNDNRDNHAGKICIMHPLGGSTSMDYYDVDAGVVPGETGTTYPDKW